MMVDPPPTLGSTPHLSHFTTYRHPHTHPQSLLPFEFVKSISNDKSFNRTSSLGIMDDFIYPPTTQLITPLPPISALVSDLPPRQTYNHTYSCSFDMPSPSTLDRLILRTNPPPAAASPSDSTRASDDSINTLSHFSSIDSSSTQIDQPKLLPCLQSPSTPCNFQNDNPPHRRWSHDDMTRAIHLVTYHSMSMPTAAQLCNVPISTLWDRVRGKVVHGVDRRRKRKNI